MIPTTQHLFSATTERPLASRPEHMTITRTGFEEPVYVLQVSGPAGQHQTAISEWDMLIDDVAKALVAPSWNREATITGEDCYIRFTFARDTLVFQADDENPDTAVFLGAQDAYAYLSTGEARVSKRMNNAAQAAVPIPAWMIVEIFQPDTDDDEESHEDLLACVLFERPQVAKLIAVIQQQRAELLDRLCEED